MKKEKCIKPDLEDLVDDKAGPLVGGLAGALVGGIAGLVLGGIVGAIVESGGGKTRLGKTACDGLSDEEDETPDEDADDETADADDADETAEEEGV